MKTAIISGPGGLNCFSFFSSSEGRNGRDYNEKRESVLTRPQSSLGLVIWHQHRRLPGVLQHLLEAALGDDLDSVIRQPVVARELFGIARDRRRRVIHRQKEPVAQAQSEDLIDVSRTRQPFHTQYYVGAEALAVLRARDRNRGNLRERRRVLVESGASDHSAARDRNDVIVDIHRDLLPRAGEHQTFSRIGRNKLQNCVYVTPVCGADDRSPGLFGLRAEG
jgi:hypothetical protein